jgi:hypothetical protein
MNAVQNAATGTLVKEVLPGFCAGVEPGPPPEPAVFVLMEQKFLLGANAGINAEHALAAQIVYESWVCPDASWP